MTVMKAFKHNITIDLHDLSEDQVEFVQEFVVFLRNKFHHADDVVVPKADIKTQNDTAAWLTLSEKSFSRDWENEKDAIYDQWQRYYRV